MNDLISREAALAEIEFYRKDWADARDAIAALPAAQVKVKPLVWEDLGFIYRAYDPASGIGFYAETKVEIDDIESIRQRRTLAALDLSPTAADASQTPDPVLSDPRVKALVEQVRALLVAADGESYAAYNAALEATDAALRAIGGEA